jgi:hypothetical protein
MRTVSCGCCSMGCTCFNHQDVPNGNPPKSCDYHREHGHPHESAEWKLRIFNIKWDTTDTGNESDYNEEEVKALKLPAEHTYGVDDDFNPDEEAADLLSDEFGFCVFSFSYEWAKK